jgi:hypothetical protein
MNDHLINRQVLDVKISRSLDAFDIQHRLSNYYYQCILPALEKIFTELSYEDATLQADKLEIDLGILEATAIEKMIFTEKFYQLLKEQVRKQLANQSSEKKIKYISNRENAASQWLFYMRRGFLGWNVLHPNNAWYQSVLESLASDFRIAEELKKLILSDSNALRRMVSDHPVNFLVNLAKILTAKSVGNIEIIVRELAELTALIYKHSFGQDKRAKEISVLVWETIIVLSAKDHAGNFTEEQFNREIVREYARSFEVPMIPEDMLHRTPVIKPILIELIKNNLLTGLNQRKRPNEIEEKVTAKADDKSAEDIVGEEGIFVPAAGLVLLHPFLPTFFKILSLTSDHKFQDLFAHQKAVQLLYYLATAQEDPKDFELIIPKLLCAYPLDKPILVRFLSDAEKEEADHLLQTVVEKWDKLKNSSPDALRGSFLQRNGKLYRKNDQLQLQVETNSLDILLDFLPWSRSIIKLPWMKDMIKVEWR